MENIFPVQQQKAKQSSSSVFGRCSGAADLRAVWVATAADARALLAADGLALAASLSGAQVRLSDLANFLRRNYWPISFGEIA